MNTALFLLTFLVVSQISAYVPRLKGCVCSLDGTDCFYYHGVIIEKTFVITLDDDDVDFYTPLKGYSLAHPNACAENGEDKRQVSVTHGTDGSIDVDGSVSSGLFGGGVHGGVDGHGHPQGGVHADVGNHWVGADVHANWDHDHGLTVGVGGHVNLGPVHVGGSVDTDVHGHGSVSGSVKSDVEPGNSVEHKVSHGFNLKDLFGKRRNISIKKRR